MDGEDPLHLLPHDVEPTVVGPEAFGFVPARAGELAIQPQTASLAPRWAGVRWVMEKTSAADAVDTKAAIASPGFKAATAEVDKRNNCFGADHEGFILIMNC